MKKISTPFLFLVILQNAAIAQAPAVEWSKTYGGPSDEVAYTIQPTADGHYAVAGWSYSKSGEVSNHHGPAYLPDVWDMLVDPNGGLVGQKSFGGTFNDRSFGLIESEGIVAASTTSSDGDVASNHGNFDYWIIKVNSAGKIVWQRSLGGSGSDNLVAIDSTADHGSIAVGYSTSNDGDVTGHHGETNVSNDAWVVKLNAKGRIEWEQSYGGTYDEFPRSIHQTSDGGYIMAGGTDSYDGDVSGNHGFNDAWVVKLSSSGQIQWQKCLGGSSFDAASDAIETTDHGFIMAGYSNSTDGQVTGNRGQYDEWIVRLDKDGNIKWEKTFGGSLSDYATSIIRTTDANYVVAGYSASDDGDVTNHHSSVSLNEDAWIIKIDDNGNLIWEKSIGGSGDDILYSVHQTRDGGYILSGSTSSEDGDIPRNRGGLDAWIVKLLPDNPFEPIKVFIGAPGELTVFPNPNHGSFTVKLSANLEQTAIIQVIDPAGQIVYSETISPMGGNLEDEVVLDASLPRETYLVRVLSGDRRFEGEANVV